MKSCFSNSARPWAGRSPFASARDRLLFLNIFLFAALVPTLLRLKLPRLAPLLEPRTIPPVADADRIQQIVRHVDTVLKMRSLFIRTGCLTRGLTLYYFLRRAGLDVNLHFGMGKVTDELAGHCWLVKDGEPFLEAKDPRPYFTAIYFFPIKGHS
jgi:hypothetical protein